MKSICPCCTYAAEKRGTLRQMLDKIFAAISMLGLVAFMGVVIIGVWEPDLWIVTILILAIAILFVWEEIKAGGSHLENEPEHEVKDG